MRPAATSSRAEAAGAPTLLAEEKSSPAAATSSRRSGESFPGAGREGYSFETEEGTKSLADLFDAARICSSTTHVGPPYEAGCTVCSSITDTIAPNAVHLAARDVTMLLVSRAPVEKLQAYKRADGGDRVGLSRRQRLQSRPRLAAPRRSCGPSSRARFPHCEAVAERSGTDVAALSRRARDERVTRSRTDGPPTT